MGIFAHGSTILKVFIFAHGLIILKAFIFAHGLIILKAFIFVHGSIEKEYISNSLTDIFNPHKGP